MGRERRIDEKFIHHLIIDFGHEPGCLAIGRGLDVPPGDVRKRVKKPGFDLFW
jgi:hypothetical protein